MNLLSICWLKPQLLESSASMWIWILTQKEKLLSNSEVQRKSLVKCETHEPPKLEITRMSNKVAYFKIWMPLRDRGHGWLEMTMLSKLSEPHSWVRRIRKSALQERPPHPNSTGLLFYRCFLLFPNNPVQEVGKQFCIALGRKGEERGYWQILFIFTDQMWQLQVITVVLTRTTCNYNASSSAGK